MLAYLRMAPWVAILLLIAVCTYQGGQIRKWHQQTVKCSEARQRDRGAYEQAQKDAQARNKAQIERVQSEQQRITNDVETSYQNDLARLRAELGQRLRPQGGTAQGAPLNPGASPVPDTTGGADAEARVCIPSDLYVRGAENELQLERLIEWVNRQLAVDPNR